MKSRILLLITTFELALKLRTYSDWHVTVIERHVSHNLFAFISRPQISAIFTQKVT